MNISEAAAKTGLSTKAIRYYETHQLITPSRTANGYRHYSADDLSLLGFLANARKFGFSVAECRQLANSYQDPARTSESVKQLALEKTADLERQLQQLTTLRSTLNRLVEQCPGDQSPDCPILNHLNPLPD